MKNNNFYIRTITFVCAFLQIFAFVGITSFASSDNFATTLDNIDGNELSINDSVETTYTLNSSGGVVGSELTYVTSTPIDIAPGAIRVIFDASDVIDYYYEVEGLTVTKIQTSQMMFDLVANEEFGTFKVVAEKSGGESLTKIIYTYYNGTTIFTSDISLDNAFHECKQYEFDNGIITMDVWESEYSLISCLFSTPETNCSFENTTEINQAVADGNVVVRGRMTWETENGEVLPLSFTKVQLRDWYKGISYPIATSETDAEGYYCFVFNPSTLQVVLSLGVDLFIRTYAESSTFSVKQPYLEEFNYFDSPTEIIFSGSKIINISRRLKSNSAYITYRLMYIQQGMVVGQRFALEMDMIANKQLHVFYFGDVKISELNENAFCYDIISFIGHDRYNDFSDTIHEYGHYVENRMGNYGPSVKGHLYEAIPNNFNGLYQYLTDFINSAFQIIEDYSHDVKDNHFSESTTKAFQMELAWSESWATAFAEIAFQYYSCDYPSALFKEDLDYETEQGGMYVYQGEAQEYAVTSFLWDLYDDTPSEPGDNISLNEKEWWNLTTQTGTYTIQDLTDNIIENYPDLINGVGEILSKHSIAPQVHGVNNSPCVNIPPKIIIEMNGSSSHPNNIFKIVFYDENNNIVSSTINVNTSKSNDAFFVYTVSNDIWAKVVEHYVPGKTIYATIYGYRTGEFTSGPYFSKYVKVLDNSMFHNYHSMEYDNTNHWEQCLCGGKRNVTSHNFTYGGFTDLGHNMVCSGCGYTVLKAHVYEYTSNGDAVHSKECACGYIVTSEEHYAFSYKSVSSSNHKVYCVCGKYIRSENHTTVTIAPLKTHCNVCGAVFNISYDFIIKGTEDEEDPCTE